MPIKTTPEAAVREIAVHVQSPYVHRAARRSRRSAAGRSRSAATRRCSSSRTPQATGGYKFFEGSSVEYQICGNTTKGNCAIDQKKISPNTSGALTRRMAYELALMTFHYVPEVQNVAVLLPAVIKGQKARMLVIARSDNKEPKSLDAASSRSRAQEREERGPPNDVRRRRSPRSTDPLIFHYEVTATSDNQPVYLITPLLI